MEDPYLYVFGLIGAMVIIATVIIIAFHVKIDTLELKIDVLLDMVRRIDKR